VHQHPLTLPAALSAEFERARAQRSFPAVVALLRVHAASADAQAKGLLTLLLLVGGDDAPGVLQSWRREASAAGACAAALDAMRAHPTGLAVQEYGCQPLLRHRMRA
jgi:uncharacterized protein (DUF1501 family)